MFGIDPSGYCSSIATDGLGNLSVSLAAGGIAAVKGDVVAVNSQTWLTGVAGTAASVDCTGYNTAVITIVGSGTISAGTVAFDISDDNGVTWYVGQARNNASFSQGPTSALALGSTSFTINVAGFTNVRARNSVTISGAAGQAIVRIQASYTVSANSVVIGQAAASNLLMTNTPVASGTLTLQASQVSAITNVTTTRTTTTSLGFYQELMILINITAAGTATGLLQIWLEDSSDGGTTWDDLVSSNTFAFGASLVTQHFFISGRIATTATQGAAAQQETLSAGTVRNGPWGDRIRVREKVSGVSGSPVGVTYTITAIAKI